VKPKSWDNLIGTKAFGGYGYGFGYGYFPSNKNMTQGHGSGSYSSAHQVTHPHHHNHHSHCTHSHSNPPTSASNNYYYNDGNGSKGPRTDTGHQKVKVVYNYVAPTYHTILPATENQYDKTPCSSKSKGLNPNSSRYSTPASAEASGTTHRCKTLPLKKNPSSSNSKAHESSFPKLEKTFSDSSLSDHHKEFPKTMSYFKRSGDNVRFSSDEEYEMYGLGRHGDRSAQTASISTSKKEKEHIFV
jgi:hypothetical protein